MEMIGHDDISGYQMPLGFKIIEPFIHEIVAVGDFNKGQPPVTGESDKQHVFAANYGGPYGHLN